MAIAILPLMRCPRCTGLPLEEEGNHVLCRKCGLVLDVRGGIIDAVGEDCREVITPFQRVMQTSLVVSVYETLWRRLGYFLASSRSFSCEIQTVLEMNRSKEASTLLDLACGTGVFTRPLARQSRGKVVGVDLSWPMLRQARRLLARAGLPDVALVRASAFRLPFSDASFSFVNCCGALHLFDGPERALSEIRRVLAPGGHLCVQTTIRPAHSGGMAYFLERFIRFGFFAEQDLREKISRAGFAVIRSERHRISFTFLCR